MLIINSAVSAHLIFYSALVFANKIKPEYADLFNAGILLGSLSVLCIGLIGAVLRMDVYSNIMHESGKLINEIKSNVSLVGRRIANPQEIDNFLRKQNARYRGHLSQVEFNHSELDHQIFIISHLKWYKDNESDMVRGWLSRAISWIRYYVTSKVIVVVFVFMPVVPLIICFKGSASAN